MSLELRPAKVSVCQRRQLGGIFRELPADGLVWLGGKLDFTMKFLKNFGWQVNRIIFALRTLSQ